MEDVDTQSSVQLRGKPLIFSEERVSESVQDYLHLYNLLCQDSKDTKQKWRAARGTLWQLPSSVCTPNRWKHFDFRLCPTTCCMFALFEAHWGRDMSCRCPAFRPLMFHIWSPWSWLFYRTGHYGTTARFKCQLCGQIIMFKFSIMVCQSLYCQHSILMCP